MLQLNHLKALLARKSGLKPGMRLPRLETVVPVGVPSKRLVRALQDIFGSTADAPLPLTFPHIAAFDAHLGHLVDPRFPIAPMGLVHIRSVIAQQRPIAVTEPLRILAWSEGGQDTEKGFEFDQHTQAFVGQELVWQSAATMLARSPSSTRTAPKALALNDQSATSSEWSLVAETALRYAWLSSDLNPIHLSALTARLFGYKRPLMHGMWSIGRIAAVEQQALQGPATLSCELKLPLLLPARVVYRRWPEAAPAGGLALRILDKSATKPHLTGTLVPSFNPAV